MIAFKTEFRHKSCYNTIIWGGSDDLHLNRYNLPFNQEFNL